MIGVVAKASIFSAGASLFAYGLTILLARGDSQSAFAAFSYTIVWALVFVQLLDLAAEQCVTHLVKSRELVPSRVVANLYTAKLACTAVLFGLVVLANEVFGAGIPYAAFLFLVPAFYLGPVFELRALNLIFVKLLLCEKIALVFFSFVYLRYRPLDMGVYLAYFGVSIASLALQFRFLRIERPRLIHFDSKLVTDYVLTYWPIYLTLIAQLAYGHFSRIVIEAKLGLIAFASVSLALQIVNSLAIVQTQVDRHVRPRIIETINANQFGLLWQLSRRYVTHYLGSLALACAVLFVCAEGLVVLLFGEQWRQVAMYLQYLTPLVISVALLRYLDILSLGLYTSRANLLANCMAAILLVTTLTQIPQGYPAHFFLLAIVAFQYMHVLVVGLYLSWVMRVRVRSKAACALYGK